MTEQRAGTERLRKTLIMLTALLMGLAALLPGTGRAESADEDESIVEYVDLDAEAEAAQEDPGKTTEASAAKQAFIEDIIALGKKTV